MKWNQKIHYVPHKPHRIRFRIDSISILQLVSFTHSTMENVRSSIFVHTHRKTDLLQCLAQNHDDILYSQYLINHTKCMVNQDLDSTHVHDHGDLLHVGGGDGRRAAAVELVCAVDGVGVPVAPVEPVLEDGDGEGVPQDLGGGEDHPGSTDGHKRAHLTLR